MEEQINWFRDVRIQGAGAVITAENRRNFTELYRRLHQIDYQGTQAKQIVDHRLEDALDCIENAFAFVGSPENILGSALTKHGEIAEHVDVEFYNAWNAMRGLPKNASFDNVGRTAPQDYYVNGVAVQSKYINGSSNSLSHVLDHLAKYENIGFGRDGSYYVIPKDQYNEITRVLRGDTGNLSEKTIRAIKEKVRQIESETGRSFFDVVKSGCVNYAEVQQGAVHKTLFDEAKKLKNNAQNQKNAIEADCQKQRDLAHDKAKPTWGKAGVAAGVSAGISGGLQLALGIQRKCKQGKKIQDFSVEDWKEIGIDTGKAAAEGGISGLAIYGMTNVANIPSPIAAAAVSLVFGLLELTHEVCCKRISKEEFLDGCVAVTINAVVCAVGAIVGDRLIPIPVFGSIIGSAIAGNICKELMGQGLHEATLYATQYVHGSTISMLSAAKEIRHRHQMVMGNVHATQQENIHIVKDMDDFFSKMEGLL